jgi:hypothetical protein
MGFWIVAVIVAAFIGAAVWRGLQMKSLAQGGVVAKGEVIQKFRRRSKSGPQASGYLKYRFDAPNGQAFTKRIAVSEQVYNEYAEGQPIDIVYLPDKPSVNGARYMVNLSRKALKLPPI